MAWLILQVLGIALLASVAYAAASGAPWVPTRRVDLQGLLDALDLKSGETLYELGCGDGRVCLAIARRFPEARVVGVELGVVQWAAARLRAWRSGLRNVEIRLGNLFSTDLTDADAVYLFLMVDTNARLAAKLRAELRPGARVFSYVFPVGDWTPVRETLLGGSHRLREFAIAERA